MENLEVDSRFMWLLEPVGRYDGAEVPMKKLLLLFAGCLILAIPAHAAKTVVGTYQTSESLQQAFTEIVRSLTSEGFVIKSADKTQGTIQADKMAWGSGTPAFSVFLTLSREDANTLIVATFSKSPGVVGHPVDKYANALGRDLKSSFPDLTMKFEKR